MGITIICPWSSRVLPAASAAVAFMAAGCLTFGEDPSNDAKGASASSASGGGAGGNSGSGSSTSSSSSGAGGVPDLDPYSGRFEDSKIAMGGKALGTGWVNDLGIHSIWRDTLIHGSLKDGLQDDYKLIVPDRGAVIRLETFESAPEQPGQQPQANGCPTLQTKLKLFDSNNKSIIEDQPDGSGYALGIGGCAAIVTFVEKGTYRINVDRAGNTADGYFLEVRYLTDAHYSQDGDDFDLPAGKSDVFVRHAVYEKPNNAVFRVHASKGQHVRAEVVPRSILSKWQCVGPAPNKGYLMNVTMDVMQDIALTVVRSRGGCMLFDGTDAGSGGDLGNSQKDSDYSISISKDLPTDPSFPYLLAVTVRGNDWSQTWQPGPEPGSCAP